MRGSLAPRRTTWLAAATAILAVGLLMASGDARAGEAAATEFRRAAYSADFTSGVTKLKAMATADPNDVEAVFGTGALQFIGAFATLQHNLYRHSAATTAATGMPGAGLSAFGMMGWAFATPVVVPPNPNAQPMTYKALRSMLERSATDLTAAEATLALIKDRPVKIVFEPGRIALDLNNNGAVEPGERVFEAMMGWRAPRAQQTGLEIAFDTADASWLRGYSHVMMATANLVLAFDFEKTFEATAHNSYGLATTAIGREIQRQMATGRPAPVVQKLIADLDSKINVLQAQRNAMFSEQSEQRKRMAALPRPPEAQAERLALMEEQRAVQAGLGPVNVELNTLTTQRRDLQSEQNGMPPGNDYTGFFDIVAAVHSISWNVVEPARLKAVRTHLLQVMALNKNTWRLVRAESDDDREWLPNARQTSPFGVRVTDEIIDSWLATTALAEQVLEGKKLLPHPRFRNKGVNLKKFLETTKRFDLVMTVTGHDLLPYLEEGEIVDGDTWRTLTNPMQGNLAMFAVWFN